MDIPLDHIQVHRYSPPFYAFFKGIAIQEEETILKPYLWLLKSPSPS
ncbi:hypothetical protein ANT_26740 [Anaerolinea thermophila UNI-1]|uniref:Uncharacterized protein n=1 Tax=Anaerolinea thermophila (strain DSM 14523 / JCM 11388 / NBRC 100420 / UNI-1) TaxID=926569 RepID=E8N0F1_ANATU|nr:hypothetical protein ANT_26740 [Anaerolinea thermophila UNI-1]